ncbi:ATP-binding protein [Nocardia cyriacigeorgica]|uniref:ATP-binding protein n=1 Tax=Nocardia cyriacigeorgica TaxID=135487 RepID=A0A6P1DH05_9NOCA|nr:ATP-binding protein [Nocardia cyriacigeorgica]NEW40082.1 ATP-binding protein [Nocardia cyriacigeorgica]NEW47652.1 ATP-binding protein [Nocardia cyriacigeorgica]NEW51592.1 ATP-binding protein [Nocardia cyriacigeorgica]
MKFAGRSADLDLLAGQLAVVTEGAGATRGRAVIVTGRRRVGKSRLLQEFCDRVDVPYLVFQATRGRNPVAEREDFVGTIAHSALGGAELVDGLRANDWNQALRALSIALPEDVPSIAVLDEVPWLVEQDGEFEGALQAVWDRQLSAKPVLLVLVGSDISVMEALQSRDRPFFGRATKMAVEPLNLADVQTMTGLDAAAAMDAHLITGGFPEIVQSWRPGMTRIDFLQAATSNPLSPLLVAGELSLLGEFPESTRSRAVLEAVGSGERTFATIAAQAGGDGALPSGTLTPLLSMLQAKRIVAADLPLSTKSDTRNKRYRIADPYLRFWLAFLQRGIPLIERGRGDLALNRIERSWTTWRGRAVEPLIRASLLRLLPDDRWPTTESIGGWWNRQNNPEIDLIGADREPTARAVHFLGSIKWLEDRPFDRHDYDALARAVLSVPGTGTRTPLVAVSRSGAEADLPLATVWGPEELVDAWR